MPFNSSFLISVTADPSTFVLSDISSGSDANITGRQVLLYQTNGKLLVPAINWSIANSSISINVLQQDIALNVVVLWISSNPLPSPSTYTSDQIFAFVKYGQDFVYGLTQDQAANLAITQDNDWYTNKLAIICLILSAQNAIDTGTSIANAQMCIALYQNYINNKHLYF